MVYYIIDIIFFILNMFSKTGLIEKWNKNKTKVDIERRNRKEIMAGRKECRKKGTQQERKSGSQEERMKKN